MRIRPSDYGCEECLNAKSRNGAKEICQKGMPENEKRKCDNKRLEKVNASAKKKRSETKTRKA